LFGAVIAVSLREWLRQGVGLGQSLRLPGFDGP
jgi:hypothetical protein